MITSLAMLATVAMSAAMMMLNNNNILWFVIFAVVGIICFIIIEKHEIKLLSEIKQLKHQVTKIDRYLGGKRK